MGEQGGPKDQDGTAFRIGPVSLGPLGEWGPVEFAKDELRDATRLALQSGLAAAACFALMRAFDLPERFVGVLSAVLVVGPSVGSTLSAAQQRLVATVVGSLIGVAAMFALPGSVGTAIALAVSLFLINWVAGFKPGWRYGTVATVALALGSEHDLTQTAIDRVVAIGVGVAIGSVVAFLVWRERAEDRALRHMRAALRATAKRLDLAIEHTRREGDGAPSSDDPKSEANQARDRYHRAISNARGAASDVRIQDAQPYRAQIDAAEHLYNSVLIVNRVAKQSSDLGADDRDFRQAVDEARKHALDITTCLGEDADEGGSLSALSDAIGQVRQHVGEVDAQSESQVLRVALLFGLEQVEDSLRRLTEAQSKAQDDAQSESEAEDADD